MLFAAICSAITKVVAQYMDLPGRKQCIHTSFAAVSNVALHYMCLVLQGGKCRSWLLPVLQEAMDSMAKEKARLRADMEYLQSQLDLVTQQAEAAAAAAGKGSSKHTSQVQLYW